MKTEKIIYRLIPYGVAVAFCLAFGGVASFFQKEALSEWYPFLQKSTLTPPGYVFPIVWSLLYVLMGIALGAVWHVGAEKKKRRYILFLWGIQCVLNFLWSICFFYSHSPLMGLVVIVLLLITVMYFLFQTYRINKVAFTCFVPYFLWLVLATYLNLYVWIYN